MNKSKLTGEEYRAHLCLYCARGALFGCMLVALGGCSMLVARIVSGSWPPVLGRNMSSMGSALVAIGFFSMGMSGILLFRRLGQGDFLAVLLFLLISFFCFLGTIILAVKARNGLYEVILTSIMFFDAVVLWMYRLQKN